MATLDTTTGRETFATGHLPAPNRATLERIARMIDADADAALTLNAIEALLYRLDPALFTGTGETETSESLHDFVTRRAGGAR